jgi:hypothetical protein
VAKLTLTNLTSLNNSTAVTNINANNDAIETALENTLSRDGTTPNTMSADLDMNSNNIINLPAAASSTEPVRKAEFDAELLELEQTVSTHADDAAASAAEAAASALEAESHADRAENEAEPGTSATSVLVGEGSKSFTTQASKPFEAGRWLLIHRTSDPTTYMHGQSTSYTDTALTVNITNSSGSGTHSDWTITVSGTRGPAGDTEVIQDVVGGMLVDGTTIDFTYDDTAGTFTAERKALTGDITASAGSNATTLATVNSNVGTFGSATVAPQITVNGKGLITAATDVTVTPAVGSITGLGAGVGTFLATPSSANLKAAVTDETGTGGALVFATSPSLTTPDIGAATGTSVDVSGVGHFGGSLRVGDNASTGDTAIELGIGRSGDGHAYLDLHASSAQDYDGRLIRSAGANGTMQLMQTGTGVLNIVTENAANITLGTNSTDRVTISDTAVFSTNPIIPSINDGAALGSTTNQWSDLHLATGGVINWANGETSITGGGNDLIFAGAANGYQFDAGLKPSVNDGGALGLAAASWSDLFLADGGVINFNNGDVTVTHSTNALNFAGGAGYTFDSFVRPASSDGATLGSSDFHWSDLFLASGSVINWNNGDVTATHAANTLTFAGATSGYIFNDGQTQVSTLEVGHASDTTISRSAAGIIAVEAIPLYSNIPQNSQSAAYTLVLADAQKHIFHPSADTTARIWTIPANSSVAFPIGTAVTFINQNSAGTITIAITTDTLRLAGTGTTGSRTLAANGVATAIKVTSTEWVISGTGLT